MTVVIAQNGGEDYGALTAFDAFWTVPFVVDYDQTVGTPLVVGSRLVLSSLDRGPYAQTST